MSYDGEANNPAHPNDGACSIFDEWDLGPERETGHEPLQDEGGGSAAGKAGGRPTPLS